MAGRSQLPVQIMENQTRFDLNAAVENWRNELAAQPNLASDDRRELETHLRDAIAGFQQRGLNDEESFWLARKRVGQPQQLVEELVKADPTKVWRGRAFWIMIVLFAFQLWNKVSPHLWEKIAFPHWNHHDISTLHSASWLDHVILSSNGVLSYALFQTLCNLLPIFCFVILFATGRMNWADRAFKFIVRSRLQFVLMSLALVLVFHYYDDSVGALTTVAGSNWFSQYCTGVLFTNLWPLALIILIAWLMLPQNRKTPKRA
jgi:hypothetical protein